VGKITARVAHLQKGNCEFKRLLCYIDDLPDTIEKDNLSMYHGARERDFLEQRSIIFPLKSIEDVSSKKHEL